MKYAVIGSAGQVGQEFNKVLPPQDVILLTRENIDVTDADSVHDCFEGLDCDVIMNLAAFHDVNGCETDPNKAFQVNAAGAWHVAQNAKRNGCEVVYFSSDYVFGLDGHTQLPYVESDPVGPLNVYGASKVAGEHLVRATTKDHLIVRTSSLFGAVTSKKGWTFPSMILRRARANEPLKVVNDQYMSPTYTLDLVRTVIHLVEAGATGTVHVTNEGGCTWFELACRTLVAAGIDYPIEPVHSDAFPSKARRPTYSRMDSEQLESWGVPELRTWKDALHAYLAEIGEVKSPNRVPSSF